jgi:cytochrome c
MDSFELNKIIGAILGTLLFVMGVGFIAEAVYEPRASGPGLSLPEPEVAEAGGAAEPVVAVPIAVLLASADVGAGENAAKKCQSCHNFAAGAGNKTGPELADVVGRVVGSHAGFAYSDVMAGHQAAGDVWSYDLLNEFLISPKASMPGTKMNFSGLKNDAERANLIAYMASINPASPPFPAPEAAPAEAAPVDAAIAPSDTAPVATDANAIETPTTTSTETMVEGTPATAPAATTTEPAAPAATTAPATTEPAAPAVQ